MTQTNISSVKAYVALTKPGIISGNLVTAFMGFALAARGTYPLHTLLATLLGLAAVVGAGCVLNNWIDRDADKKMERTKKRPLVSGVIPVLGALIFSLVLLTLGLLDLTLFANPLTAVVALIGFFVYVMWYTFAKYITTFGTLIGSIAGAVPPVAGYTALSNQLDLAALILFLIVVSWQMPHFFAISIFRIGEYKAASIPVMPIVQGNHRTKIHMCLWTLVFITVTTLLTALGYTNLTYMVGALALGISWFVICLQGFKVTSDKVWARKVFRFSLVVITLLCVLLSFNTL